MKFFIKYIAIIILITIISIPLTAISQGNPPPPPPGHGSSGNQTGGNAPIGGGLFILLGLGAVYGGRKVYKINQEG